MNLFSHISDDAIVDALQAGAVGVLPCDTVYGVVCSATNAEAVGRLYALKHRERKPGTIIAADIDQLVELGLKKRYLTPVAEYWPGAVSVVIQCGIEHPELAYLHQGIGSLAVRLPAGDALQALLRRTGPLLTSSANLPGQPPAARLDQAREYFGDAVDFYVEGGDMTGHLPSTVIRIVDDAVEVLRPGAVTMTE